MNIIRSLQRRRRVFVFDYKTVQQALRFLCAAMAVCRFRGQSDGRYSSTVSEVVISWHIIDHGYVRRKGSQIVELLVCCARRRL